jgi:tRNA threonylcarbamoyladenosine biosynthesis protein TsaB
LKFLAFDTATEWCSAALWLDGACVHREVHAGQKHSDLLVPMLMQLLAESGLTLHQLDGLVYGMGPGSFTGLRIASGVAQGLALAADLPVLGVSTLETLAEEADADQVLACLDARMHEVYAALYERQSQREGQPEDKAWHCLAGPLVCPPDAVPLPEGDGYVGVGSGFAAYPNLARLHLSRVDASLIPHARAMARLAAPRLQRGEGESAEKAEPLYIRNKVALKICER